MEFDEVVDMTTDFRLSIASQVCKGDATIEELTAGAHCLAFEEQREDPPPCCATAHDTHFPSILAS